MGRDYKPEDSRNATGTSGQPQQQSGMTGQQGGANDVSGQQPQQLDNTAHDRAGSGDAGFATQIREHMEVIGADGAHVGTVDHIDGDRIKLTRADSGEGGHEGHHHFLPLSQVASIEGDQVRLAASGAVAYGMEAEE